VKCCVQWLKQSAVTVNIAELVCSHARAVFIYNEELPGSCTLWGVVPTGTDLLERYVFFLLSFVSTNTRVV